MITCSINVTRIDKSALVDGKNGKYLALCLFENKNGPDQYGNDGFITQDLGKERRAAGEKGAILGNYRNLDKQAPPQNAHNQAKSNGYQPQADSDEIPF